MDGFRFCLMKKKNLLNFYKKNAVVEIFFDHPYPMSHHSKKKEAEEKDWSSPSHHGWDGTGHPDILRHHQWLLVGVLASLGTGSPQRLLNTGNW